MRCEFNLIIAGFLSLTLASCETAAEPTITQQHSDQSYETTRSRVQSRTAAECETKAPQPDYLENLIRIPPRMPSGATESGECKVNFNINAKGETTDIWVYDCTNNIYSFETYRTVSTWGMATGAEGESICGIEQKMTFNILP